MNPKLNHVYFNQKEVMILSMALAGHIEDLKNTENYDWNDQTKKDRKEMLEAANSAMDKLVKHCGAKRELPPYIDGDEKQFLN
jgi:hypothetical protein